MRKKRESQLPLDLAVRSTNIRKAVGDPPSTGTRSPPTERVSPVRVYSFSDRKAEREKSESAKHFRAILQLVDHFK